MNCSRTGRVFNTELNNFFRTNILQIVLLLMALLYLPMTASVLSSVNCASYQCDVGSEFVQADSAAISSWISIQNSFTRHNALSACTSCNYNASTCSIGSQLCPGGSQLLLVIIRHFIFKMAYANCASCGVENYFLVQQSYQKLLKYQCLFECFQHLL